jgi:hypothetical protein
MSGQGQPEGRDIGSEFKQTTQIQKFAFTIIPTNFIVMISAGEYSPITGTIGFVEGEPHEVANAFFKWQAPLFAKTTSPLEIEEQDSMSFSDAMTQLSILTTRASRWIFMAAGVGHTAMFSNCSRGLDPSPISPLAVKKCRKKGFRVTAVSNVHRGKKYSSRIVEVFSPECSNPFNIERSLYCANDGGKWKFGSSGTPYAFEDESRYESPSVKDRFTINDVWEFMRHFQIDGDSESFYGGERRKAYKVFMNGELLPNMKEVLLSEIV